MRSRIGVNEDDSTGSHAAAGVDAKTVGGELSIDMDIEMSEENDSRPRKGAAVAEVGVSGEYAAASAELWCPLELGVCHDQYLCSAHLLYDTVN